MGKGVVKEGKGLQRKGTEDLDGSHGPTTHPGSVISMLCLLSDVFLTG